MKVFLDLLNNFYVDGIEPFSSFFEFKFHRIPFRNTVDATGNMNEIFGLTFLFDDESETFGFIEKLNGTFFHGNKIIINNAQR